MKKQRSILLFGGGKETAYNLLTHGNEIKLLLYIKYGQKAYIKEVALLKKLAAMHKIPYKIIIMPVSVPTSIQTGKPNKKGSNVPYRNPLFICLAANLCYEYKCNNVIVGNTKSASSEYANDGGSSFLRDFKEVLSHLGDITFNSNSSKKTPKQIVDYVGTSTLSDKVWFCENDLKKHCGKCNKCHLFFEERHSIYKNSIGYRNLLKNLF